MSLRKTVSFAGTCAARSELTLVAPRITRPFVLHQVAIQFPAGTLNLMTVDFWLSPDNAAPTSGPPTGDNILVDYGQVNTIRGEGEQITMRHQIHVEGGGCWLKVHANNTDFYDHAVTAQIEIETDLEEGA